MKNTYGLMRTSGDTGTSDLFSGEKVSKASVRMEVLGELDELGSLIGVTKIYTRSSYNSDFLQIQRLLFTIGSEIATIGKSAQQLTHKIDHTTVEWLEQLIQSLLKKTQLPKGFILSGSNQASSYLHLTRAVTRRCERRLVKLYEMKQLKNEFILTFINRLSVYFFVLSVAHDKTPILAKSPQ